MTLSRRALLTSLAAHLTPRRSRPVAFTNPITGGQGALVRPAIKSPNYVPGVSGWSVNRTGSAEFNNLTIRGTFNGTTFQINSLGAFFYTGTPAAGNLSASVTSAAGANDGFGNAFQSGFSTYTAGVNVDHIDNASGNARFGASTGAHLSIDAVNGLLQLADTSGNVQIVEDAGRQAVFIYSGAPATGNLTQSIAKAAGTDGHGNAFPAGFTTYDRSNSLFVNTNSGVVTLGALVAGSADLADGATVLGGGSLLTLTSTRNAGNPDGAALAMFSGQGSQATGSGLNPAAQLLDVAGTSDADLTISGSVIKTQQNGAAYTWQTPTPNTNWALGSSASASYQPLRFRLTAENRVRLWGAVHATAATPSNTVFTLPAGYMPKGLSGGGSTLFGNGALVSTTNTDALKLVGRVALDNLGRVVVGGFTIANGDNFYFDHEVELGQIA